MFIVDRLARITLFEIVLFAFLFLWLRARYGDRPWFRRFRWWYAGLALAYIGLVWSTLWLGRENGFPGGAVSDFLIHVYMAWYLQGIVLLPMLLVALAILYTGRIWRSLRDARNRKNTGSDGADSKGRPPGISRGSFLARTGALAALGVDAAPLIGPVGVLSGIFLGSREVIIRRVPLPIEDLHDDLRGLRVVQISDVHVGPVITDRYLNYCLGMLADLRGDVLCVTGDLIDFHNRALPELGRFLQRATDYFPLGVYVITGNHDYFYDGARLKRELRRGDFRLLTNESQTLRRGRGRLEIAGLDYPWPFYPTGQSKRRALARKFFQHTLGRAVPEAGRPRILLNHDPDEFEWIQSAPERIDLVLSGHTHGGQVHVPGPEGGTWIPVQKMYPFIDGLYRKKGRALYVNRGLGHGLPLRIDCPPEITLFEFG